MLISNLNISSFFPLVFRLQSSTKASTILDDGGENSSRKNQTTLFALAPLDGTEMITTAHERDMVQWREMVENSKYDLSSIANSSIAPADDLATVEARENKYDNTNFDDKNASKKSSSSIHKPFAGQRAKAVTAKEFFGGNSKKTASNKKATSSSSTTSSTSVAATADSKKPEKKSFFGSTSNTKPKAQTEEKENKKNQKASSSRPTSSSRKKVGNADDFVADEEESDDDEEVVQATTASTKKKSTRKVAPVPPPMDDDHEEDDIDPATESPSPPQSPQKVHGAMDAFAERTKKTKSPDHSYPASSQQGEGRKRKRRKKMVEKTSLVNGYLRTEVQAVWEDIPTDEEEEEEKKWQEKQQQIATKKKQIAGTGGGGNKSKPQQMKQKSLMGFFAKKK